MCSKELNDFLEAFKNSASELDWIGVNLDPSEDSRYSRSSENLQDLLASFSVVNYYSEDNFPESTGQLVGGDAWYSNFRSNECRNGNCPRRVHTHKHPGKKKPKKIKVRKHKSKNSDENIEVKDATARSKLHDSVQSSESEKSDSRDPDYDDYDLQENLNPKSNKQSKGESNKQEIKDKGNDRDSDLKDQLEESKNDLSHEADYKLSKSEQDAMDKKARANGSWPLSNPEFELNLLHRRQQPDYLLNNPRGPIRYHRQDKRSLNPSDEIKLRVSNRMMSKGFGPSLPSDALIDHKHVSVDDILDNSPIPSPMLRRSKRDNKVNFSEIIESLKENLREEFDPGDLSSFFHLPSPTITNNISILKDEDFIHSGRKLLQYNGEHDTYSETLNGIKDRRSPKDPLFEDTVQVDMDPDLLGNINPFNKKPSKNSSMNCDIKVNPLSGKDVRFKFQVAINATILNSTSLEGANLKDGDVDEFDNESVEKREIIFPSVSSDIKRKTNEAVQNTIQKATDAEQHPLDELMTGRFSSQVVNAIYKLAKYNKDFRQHIWPGLKNSCAESKDRFKDISFLKTSYSQEQVKKTEMMVREMMQMINTLIEQQIRSRTCIPLRPDLQSFYNQVLQFRSNNDEQTRAGRKRKAKEQYQDWHNVVKRRVLSEPKIRRTKSVVKKLLNQFDYLPTDEQERNKDIKDMLQMHLVYLRELERETDDDDYQNRRKRSIVVRNPSKTSVGFDNIETGIGNITPDFEKLVRTAELIRKNSLVTDESYDYLSFQSNDYL